MLKIAVCDDETIVAANIEMMLEELALKTATLINTDVFYDGSTLVDYIKQGNRYDIIYLDIEMLKQNGVDAARVIREWDKNVLIIYVTSHESFAKEVFEVSAFRFITKPIDKRIFSKYFEDAKKAIMGEPKYFQYKYNKISYRLPINEINVFSER